jgi:hypothetical protein
MDPGTWSSLEDEVAVATDLYGGRGPELVRTWLDAEAARVTDQGFAVRFCEDVRLPGIATDDYLHRLIHTSHGHLLGGIRFYGRDVSRPFVEIVAHDFEDLDRLRRCVRAEWSMFAPGFLRLCTRPGRLSGPNVLLDVSIFLARHADMRAPSSSVILTNFADVDAAIEMVRRRYERLTADEPKLSRNLSPAHADDLRRWHHGGELKAIMVDDESVGLLAVAPGRIRWLDGDEINEEVIDFEHSGRGYAALAQAAWARYAAANPRRLLIGAIDGLNVASRRTAVRAGRRRLLDLVFVSLQS